MAKTISQNTKDRLKEAVHDLTILVDDGLHPTNALVKVAKSLDLTDDQTRLVGRAYNTAHTSDVREKGAGILEKLATTPIADCEEAVSKLNTTKTASTDEISNIYSTNLDISQLRGLSTKVAEDISLQTCKLASTKKAEPIKEASLNRLLSDSQLLDLEISKLAGKAETLKDNLNAATVVLKKYASRATDPVLMATKIAAVQQFGKEVLPYLEDCFNVENPTMKLASYDEDLMTRIKKAFEYGQELSETVQLLNKVAQCRNAVNGDIKKKVGTEKLADDNFNRDLIEQQDKANLQKVDASYKKKSPAATHHTSAQKGSNKDSLLGLLANPALASLKDTFGVNAKQAPDTNSLIGEQVSLTPSVVQYGVRTPSHQRTLDSIRIKSVVNDMLSNDDIISQYDPEEVYGVYNELMATAPDAMSRPMVARSFVREALAKGNILGSYDLNPLMTYDKDIARAKGGDKKKK
jgi:hypothetical protein